MRRGAGTAAMMLAALLSGCGGGGSSSPRASGGTASVTPTPTPTPTPVTSAACSLRARQDWVAAQMDEWYLFPETLPAALDPAPFGDLPSYVDALTETARNQGRDRYFTYVTSIAEENAYYESGESAGFGFRLGFDQVEQRLAVIESFENTPALAAGIDRGTEIVAIGTTASNLRSVDTILAAQGIGGIIQALGPDTAGTARVLRVADASGTRTVTIGKTAFELLPVSSRYGAKVIEDAGRRVGYLNLRTFISTADPALREAFASFRAQGITELVVDLRYNGGGLISTAELMGDLMGGGRTTSDVLGYTSFRPEKASENETRYFAPQPESIAPMRVAFIGTDGTASASELVINAFIPYLGQRAALIGSNTFGKPVGQIALDQPECDDRLRVVALAVENADRQGAYYQGLANTVRASCAAPDDLSYPLGDPREASLRQALDFLNGRSCSAIGGATASAQRMAAPPRGRALLAPERPSTAQREVPGLF